MSGEAGGNPAPSKSDLGAALAGAGGDNPGGGEAGAQPPMPGLGAPPTHISDAVARYKAAAAKEAGKQGDDPPPDPKPGDDPPPDPKPGDDPPPDPKPGDDPPPDPKKGDDPPDPKKGDDPPEDGDDDFVSLELPDHIREQGLAELEVPKEQEQVFRAILNSSISKRELQTQRENFAQYRDRMETQYREASLAMYADPLGALQEVLKDEPGEAEQIVQYHLMSDPERWKRHVQFVQSLTGDENAGRFDLEHDRRRVLYEGRLLRAESRYRRNQAIDQRRTETVTALKAGLEKIPEGDRDFVQRGLVRDLDFLINQALDSNNGAGKYPSSERIQGVIDSWVGRFSGERRPSEEARRAAVKEAQDKVRARARKQKSARQVAGGGAAAPGAETLAAKLSKMTLQEQADYWKNQS